MRILIITPNYDPDLGPSAPLFTMLAEQLAARGHAVKVITAVPHYPTGQVPAQFRGKWFWHSVQNGVEVTRVGLPSVKRQSLAQRLLQFLIFQLGATLAEVNHRFDIAIITNPAIQVWLPFTWSAIIRHKPVLFSVHDVYPEVGISLGIFKTKWQVAIVGWLERFCLSHAAHIRILSDTFKPGLSKLDIPQSRLSLIYDWVDTALIHPLPQDNLFSQRSGFSGRSIVLYAGNIGLSQGLENLLSAAEVLAEVPNLQFVFVGDGTGRETLERQTAQKHLGNVSFIPFQPRHILPEVLASADIAVVVLKHGMATSSLPSKIFSIMASGRPILISVDEDSEAWQLINQAGAGVWVPPEDPSKLADTILKLMQDESLRLRLSRDGRQWAEQHHSPQFAAEQFEKLLVHAVHSNK